MDGHRWTTECKAFFTTTPVVLGFVLLLLVLVLYGVSFWHLLPGEIVVPLPWLNNLTTEVNLVQKQQH